MFSQKYTSNFVCLILVFMWRSHNLGLKTTFPSEVLVISDKRSNRNLAFDIVLAGQDSLSGNRACLNYQAFPLRDMKWQPEKVVA